MPVFQKQVALIRQLEDELHRRGGKNQAVVELQQQLDQFYVENDHLTRENAILKETIKVGCWREEYSLSVNLRQTGWPTDYGLYHKFGQFLNENILTKEQFENVQISRQSGKLLRFEIEHVSRQSYPNFCLRTEHVIVIMLHLGE